MPISCPDCAAQMPDTAAYCPGCGRALGPIEPARGALGALPETLAGGLAYFLLPAIVFLFAEPYRSNRFVRFHCFQCLALCLAAVVVGALLRVMGLLLFFILFFIPVLSHLLLLLVSMIAGLAFFVVWVVLVVKALQGEMFKLPVLGDFAERHAAAG